MGSRFCSIVQYIYFCTSSYFFLFSGSAVSYEYSFREGGRGWLGCGSPGLGSRVWLSCGFQH